MSRPFRRCWGSGPAPRRTASCPDAERLARPNRSRREMARGRGAVPALCCAQSQFAAQLVHLQRYSIRTALEEEIQTAEQDGSGGSEHGEPKKFDEDRIGWIVRALRLVGRARRSDGGGGTACEECGPPTLHGTLLGSRPGCVVSLRSFPHGEGSSPDRGGTRDGLSSVGTGEGDQLVGVAAHLPPELVHPAVVGGTQRDQVGQHRRTPVDPVAQVVHVGDEAIAAARETAPAVAPGDLNTLGRCRATPPGELVQDGAVGSLEGDGVGSITREPPGDLRRDRA